MIINLFGSPGSGKSTIRAGLFYLLKINGYNVEEVVEFAKDLTWEKRELALKCQPYVLGKQLKNIERVIDQVDIVVTDSPILLSSFYPKKYFPEKYPESFHTFVLDQFKQMGGLNFFINRVKPYQKIGRGQTEKEAIQIAWEMQQMLARHGISYTSIDGDEQAAQKIYHLIQAQNYKKVIV